MNFPARPVRRTVHLQKARVSIPHARYFITCSAVRPTSGLIQPPIADHILAIWRSMEHDRDMKILIGSIMPDHIHLLIQLGDRLTLGQVVAKMKSATRGGLNAAQTSRQHNYFEHRLRPDDDANAFARYIFLNPYRAGLISSEQAWPHCVMGKHVDFDFTQQLKAGKLPPEIWLKMEWEELGVDESAVGKD